jgi:hypothetical protein
MSQVDQRLVVLSSKRSTHHAFLEGILQGKRYIYDNNVVVTANGTLNINRTMSADEPAHAPMVYAASLERRYSLPSLYRTSGYQDLERRHVSSDPARRVVYLRDPLNTLASTYSAHLKTEYFSDFKYVTANLGQWVDVARYVLEAMDGETFIYANRFWEDENYRRLRLDAIGVRSYQLSDELSRFGGGGNTYLGDKKRGVTPMALKTRYLNYAKDAKYVGLVRENLGVFRAFCEHVDDQEMLEALRAF